MRAEDVTNVHLRQLITDLLLKARLMDDPASIDALMAETLPKVVRVVQMKEEWLDVRGLVDRYPRIFESENVVRNHVQRGTGPRGRKFGPHRQSKIRWKVADVEAWILEHEVFPAPRRNESGSSEGKP